MEVSRRAAIAAAVAALAAGGTAGVLLRECRRETESEDPLGALEGITILGQAYLARHPEERDPGLLARAVFGRREPSASVLRRQVCADLMADRIFEFDGWILSRTEGRLAALVLLLAPAA